MREAALGALSECLSAFMRHLCDTCIISDKAVEHRVSSLRNILNMEELEGSAFCPHAIQRRGHNTALGSCCQKLNPLLATKSLSTHGSKVKPEIVALWKRTEWQDCLWKAMLNLFSRDENSLFTFDISPSKSAQTPSAEKVWDVVKSPGKNWCGDLD